MKKLLSFIVLLAVVSLACNAVLPPAETAEPAPPATEVVTSSTVDMQAKLAELGGAPCDEIPDLTCVTIAVPLDHFDPANSETIDVVFGVKPADGERYGMFIQAYPGGPGGEGIGSAYLEYISEPIQEHYDIVFYDQRGLGLSTPLECPQTYAESFLEYLTFDDTAGVEGLDTAAEQQEAIEDSRIFAEECVAEMGIDPSKLKFFGTDQVAEDLETFRAIIGDEKMWIYGVSYGTAVAQTYAYAHPDRLAGMILDGTIDMTLNAVDSSLDQERAFEKVLLAVLEACNEDEYCREDMGGQDAVAVYDEFAAKVAADPIEYEFPLPNGESVKGVFTFNAFEYTAGYQMYAFESRMLLLKALASANNGDIIPMLRLMYENATVDPATFAYLGDPTFSDAMFQSVLCTDDAFFDGTPDERVQQTIEAGQASNGTVPRLDGSVYTGLTCAFWPSAPARMETAPPLTLEGVPVLVLNATLDPATPFEEGEAVFKNLADGYHIYVEGGVHSIYGYGRSCPDDYVTDLLVDGTRPPQRETICRDWDYPVISPYIQNLPERVDDFADPLEMMFLLDSNLFYLPEVYLNSWTEERSIGCTYGGTYTFAPSDVGETHTYDQCAMMPGLALSGSGTFDYDASVFSMSVQISGDKSGALEYTYNFQTGVIAVEGKFDGQTVDLSSQ